jgi:small subunit ribosomal protein S8
MYHVADFIIRIKNASAARRKEVVMPYSKISKSIAKLLVKEGFLADVKEAELEGKKVIQVGIRYVRRKPVVSTVTIISKPSLRAYFDIAGLKGQNRKDSTTLIISTSKGIMTAKQALKENIGGELLFKIG